MNAQQKGLFEPEFSCLINQLALKGLWRFGKAGFFSDYNGCGWIAVYNLLRLLGRKTQPEEVLRWMEPHALFGGRLGLPPFALSACLRREGFLARWRPVWPWSRNVKPSSLGAAMVLNRVGLHYVAFRRLENGSYQFYNEKQGDAHDIRPFADFLKAQRCCVLLLRVCRK